MRPKIKHITELGGKMHENKQVVYIAGKVTGLPQKDVEAKFNNAMRELTDAGYFVINPVQIVHADAEHKEAMRICLSLLPHADFIYLLHDWQDSKGAQMEKQVADMLGIEVYRQNYDKNEAPDNIYFI